MEPEIPSITPGYESIREFNGRWAVAHTRSRFEKALAGDLLRLGINYYLPLRLKTYVSSGKKRRSMLPIFTSYLFYCLENSEDKAKIFKTGRVTSVMEIVDQDKFINELSAIQTALQADMNFDVYDKIPVGQKCRVACGALLGTEGTVIECRPNKSKVVMEVSVLGKGVAMEIDSSMLEVIRE